jgi:hypothetical protein
MMLDRGDVGLMVMTKVLGAVAGQEMRDEV